MGKERQADTIFDIEAFPKTTIKKDKPIYSSPDKWIDDLVGVFCDPIIVHGNAWADIIPEWLASQIKIDRLLEMMLANRENREPMGTDSEALAYLMPACLEFPFDYDWTQIYLYLGCKVYESSRTPTSGTTFPDDIRVEELVRDQGNDLLRLKRWIYYTKLKHRSGRRKEIKAQLKEEETQLKQEAQPSFFDF